MLALLSCAFFFHQADRALFGLLTIPIQKDLGLSDVQIGWINSVLSWTLACGTDVGGSATPIGASANVVGVSIATQNGHFIGWGKYCKVMAPITILTLLIAMICIYVRYL